MRIPTSLLGATQLDRKLPELRAAADSIAKSTGTAGWISTLRESLGMTTGALARRLHVKQQTAAGLEKSERAGSITLASLRRAADALDADFVYALVPRKKLRDTISARARAVATRRVASVANSMQLEAQGLSKTELDAQVEELTKELERRPRELWR